MAIPYKYIVNDVGKEERNLERRRLKTLSHTLASLTWTRSPGPGDNDKQNLKYLSHVPSRLARGLDMAKCQLHHRTRPDPGCHVDPSYANCCLLLSAHPLSTFPIAGQLLFPVSLGISIIVSQPSGAFNKLYLSTTLSRPHRPQFSSFPYAFTAPFVPISHLTAINA